MTARRVTHAFLGIMSALIGVFLVAFFVHYVWPLPFAPDKLGYVMLCMFPLQGLIQIVIGVHMVREAIVCRYV